MKDIDFDELDRAVSSLMKNAPKGAAPTKPDATKVLNLGGDGSMSTSPTLRTESSDVAPAVSSISLPKSDNELPTQVAEEGEAIPMTQRDVPAPLSVAKRGRFMDVVRPATGRDARKPLSTTGVSRQGSALEPIQSIRPIVNTSSSDDSIESESAADTPEPTVSENSYESFTQTATLETVEEKQPVKEQVFSQTGAIDDSMPLNSPFLPDAKVQKRPLGRSAEMKPTVDLAAELAKSESVATEELPSVTDDSISPNKDAQLPEQPLPAELGSELLSIETSTDNLPEENQLLSQPEAVKPVYGKEAQSVPASAPTTARAMTVTSIPQQYKVKPSHDETEPTGAIYDTQPLAHPAKGKPGWLWVAAIVVILLLGAGSGAAVYYLGLL